MKMLPQFIGVILILAFSGCSTLPVNTNYDSSANFTGLKTYDWMPDPQEVIDDPRVDWELLSSRIRTAADRELSAKDFIRQTSGSPDFLIGYGATLDKKMTWNSVHRDFGHRYFGPAWAPEEYEEGTLVLDIVEPDSQKLIWSGSATDRVHFSLSPEKEEAEINEAVREILKDFPPK